MHNQDEVVIDQFQFDPNVEGPWVRQACMYCGEIITEGGDDADEHGAEANGRRCRVVRTGQDDVEAQETQEMHWRERVLDRFGRGVVIRVMALTDRRALYAGISQEILEVHFPEVINAYGVHASFRYMPKRSEIKVIERPG